MATITITQTPTAGNLFLYPESDVMTGQSVYPVSPATHWDKVDDARLAPDEDGSYVYANQTSNQLDTFNLGNSSGLTGTINYIKVFSRAKSNLYPQHPTGVYQHKIVCGAGSALSPNYAPLTTVYQNLGTVWTTNPADGLAWDWADIDALVAGIQANSPQVTMTGLLILRPNAAGFYNNHYWHSGSSWGYGGPNNYSYVDEAAADTNDKLGDGSGVGGTWRDFFSVPNHTTETWPITSVELFCYGQQYQPHQTGSFSYLGLLYSGTDYYSAPIDWPLSTWVYRSAAWLTCPWTSSAWTWTDIDDMQIGIKSVRTCQALQYYYAQLYAVVNYAWVGNPEIRTTQEYVQVNYTPDPLTITLLAPSQAAYRNTRKTNRYLFPDGTYRVADAGRQDKTLSLQGAETTNAIQKMRMIQTMQANKDPVVLAGMMDVNQDTSWRIQDFDYIYDTDRDHYAWTLNLKAYTGGV